MTDELCVTLEGLTYLKTDHRIHFIVEGYLVNGMLTYPSELAIGNSEKYVCVKARYGENTSPNYEISGGGRGLLYVQEYKYFLEDPQRDRVLVPHEGFIVHMEAMARVGVEALRKL